MHYCWALEKGLTILEYVYQVNFLLNISPTELVAQIF